LHQEELGEEQDRSGLPQGQMVLPRPVKEKHLADYRQPVLQQGQS
jgi:hypothetical protein